MTPLRNHTASSGVAGITPALARISGARKPAAPSMAQRPWITCHAARAGGRAAEASGRGGQQAHCRRAAAHRRARPSWPSGRSPSAAPVSNQPTRANTLLKMADARVTRPWRWLQGNLASGCQQLTSEYASHSGVMKPPAPSGSDRPRGSKPKSAATDGPAAGRAQHWGAATSSCSWAQLQRTDRARLHLNAGGTPRPSQHPTAARSGPDCCLLMGASQRSCYTVQAALPSCRCCAAASDGTHRRAESHPGRSGPGQR